MLGVMASAGVGWVTGLNPGVPADRVTGTDGPSPVEAASFLTGLPVRSVEPWSTWEWVRPRRHGTLVHGFLFGFTYEDGFASGETSLALDGLWLYAMTAYEDYLQPARRAPAPDPMPPLGRSVHVASAEGSASGGVLQFLVHVADEAGAPVPAVRVIVLWEGVVPPDEPLEGTFTTNECLTGPDGACLVTLAPNALDAARPITAAVAHLEHLQYAYDISADAGSKIAAFP
jgi:hypothetical protein